MNKNIAASLAVLIVILTVLLGVYFYKFSGGLSSNPNDWASFGTYIGGVATPLALLATLVALLQNDIHRRAEANRYINETACNDIKIQIDKLESDLKLELERVKFTIVSGGINHQYPCIDALDVLPLLSITRL